jgi:hypothetical protein
MAHLRNARHAGEMFFIRLFCAKFSASVNAGKALPGRAWGRLTAHTVVVVVNVVSWRRISQRGGG